MMKERKNDDPFDFSRLAVRPAQKEKKDEESCSTCRYRSDEFTSACVNAESPRCCDFVEKDYWCPGYASVNCS